MLAQAKVTELGATAHGVQYLVCQYHSARNQSVECRAINYLELGLPLAVGAEVLLNITALELGLGTGGYAFVVPGGGGQMSDFGSNAESASCRPLNNGTSTDGHIIKLRYTPLQKAVLSVEEPASPYHDALADASDLKGLPVVCCELHSQMPLVAAAVRSVLPTAKIAYIMTDQAALPLAFSELAAQALAVGLIDTTITCGQAFGGELEAVNLHSALCACQEVCAADIAIVAPGPGIVGTATALGHGGVAQGEALNAVGALNGVPIAVARLSFADKRQRHQGLSHHTICALNKIARVDAVLPIPAIGITDEQRQVIEQQLDETDILENHGLIAIDYKPATIDLHGIEVKTMGRTQADDPAFFAAACAAGVLAGRLPAQRSGSAHAYGV